MTAYEFERVFRHERFSDYLKDGGARHAERKTNDGERNKSTMPQDGRPDAESPDDRGQDRGSVYSVKGTTGKYLIVQRKTELERTVYEVFTIYVTDFVDLVYNNGDNKGVKVVKA